MEDEKKLTRGEEILQIIKKSEDKGMVVFWALDELAGMELDQMISQPTEGLLYDLNRDEATCATWILSGENGDTWVNNYACALVITRLKERLDEMEKYIIRTVIPDDQSSEDYDIWMNIQKKHLQ